MICTRYFAPFEDIIFVSRYVLYLSLDMYLVCVPDMFKCGLIYCALFIIVYLAKGQVTLDFWVWL